MATGCICCCASCRLSRDVLRRTMTALKGWTPMKLSTPQLTPVFDIPRPTLPRSSAIRYEPFSGTQHQTGKLRCRPRRSGRISSSSSSSPPRLLCTPLKFKRTSPQNLTRSALSAGMLRAFAIRHAPQVIYAHQLFPLIPPEKVLVWAHDTSRITAFLTPHRQRDACLMFADECVAASDLQPRFGIDDLGTGSFQRIGQSLACAGADVR